MTIYFTSDNHYGHHNIIRYSNRPFSSIDEMNETMINNHNSVISKDDLVYHLGDFALDEARYTKPIISRLNGINILIPGNHDACHPRKKKCKKMAQVYKSWGFADVLLGPFVEFEPGILLSHCPSADYADARYPEYRPTIDSYKVLLHGHIHQRWQTKINTNGSLMINVGVDVWNYTPVRLDTLRELMFLSIKK